MRQFKITNSITNRIDPSVDIFLQEIGKEKLISVEEEIELIQRRKAGDPKAIEKLVRANLRFVVSVAKQYQNQGLPLSDLIDEGCLGLITAAERFDETRGFKFISYAVWWIRQSILSSLSKNSRTIRLPLNIRTDIRKIKKISAKFEQENERLPELDELSMLTEIPEDQLICLQSRSKKILSVDVPFSEEDDDYNLLNVLVNAESLNPEQGAMTNSRREDILRLIKFSNLNKKEKSVIIHFFGIGCESMSLESLGDKFDMTKGRIRQIREKAISKLKRSPSSEILKKYLG